MYSSCLGINSIEYVWNHTFAPMLDKVLQSALEKRENENALRSLKLSKGLVDFCSNDYLGFSKRLKTPNSQSGSTGSRLIAGHHQIHDEVESQVAAFHDVEGALIFNSGYDANLGFFSTVPSKCDTVIYDQLCHASIRDGLRLGNARSFSFKHNDLKDLKQKLSKAKGNIFVVVESIYSMDGDSAPLKQIEEICFNHQANLVVDEAHATGVFGLNGEGLCAEIGVETYARVHTFGKALGCHGAAVCGSQILKDYLINFARPFIYTTALPPHSLEVIKQAYSEMVACEEKWHLKKNIEFFKSQFQSLKLIESNSPIQCIVLGDNSKCKNVAISLQTSGLDIRPILSPTVEKGKERIRICLHSFNSRDEIAHLCSQLNELI